MSYRAGFCGLIGLPNAGKSSLMNWLVEDKISIVTPKAQTTRRRVLGLWSRGDKDRIGDQIGGQIVFVDAPGLIRSDKGLNAFLQAEAEDVMGSSDVLLFVLNLDQKEKSQLDRVMELAKSSAKPKAFVVMKTDLQAYEHRRTFLRKDLQEKFPDTQTFWVSTIPGKDSDEVEQLREWVLRHLPEASSPLYDPEIMTPHSLRELAVEFVREQCFMHLHQEVPYGLNVRVNKFEEEPGLHKIYAEILVERDGHKSIVIGQKGSTIKTIGTAARQAMEKAFGQKVFLDLHVSVVEGWDENPRLMKEFGYVVE